uniref:VWFA domain-containing protein n=3 Tax=Acrobeloides nanus TaxID=290746 RepID=A0A914EJA8_9BILA
MLLYGLFLVLSVSRAAEDGKSTRGLATAVKRFSERLKNTFNEQTRFTLIEKGFVENIYGKTEASFLDFIKITDETHKKVKVLFEKKIHAVRNDTNCESYLRRIGTYNVYNMTKNLNPKKSAVHINIESYKCGNSVLRDFEWTGHGKIEEVMKQNLDEDPTILRQYIGTYSGLTRLLPAIKWEIEPPDVTFDLFDPRFRPWFVGAESAPKDILFLLDYSGSVKGQTLYLIKVTILYILTTLTPNDYFNAIWYNSQQDFVLGSHHNCTDGFLPATTRNKRMLRDYLNKIEEHDQASLPPALNMSFAQFIKSNSNDPDKINARSGGHQIIMLFTDGGLEEWPTNIVLQHLEQYPENNVRVFGYSMGFSTGRAPLEWTSCETKGDSTIIDTITDVKTQSRFHLKKLSEILALTYKDKKLEERPIIWSPSYMDTQKAGAVLSASLPILNTMENATAGFLGIAAVDLSFSQIRKIIPVHDQFYGFIIDNNGIVLFHPHLKLPVKH